MLLPLALFLAAGTANLAGQCDGAHRLTAATGQPYTGWPIGQQVQVYFEAGQPGDLNAAQEVQFLSGLAYWVYSENPGRLSFVNAGTGDPQGAVGTIYVTVNSAMADTTAGSTDSTLDSASGETLSSVIELNRNFVDGSLPITATSAFRNQYLTFMAAHEGGHTLGFDDDYGLDGSSVMVPILTDDQSSDGVDLGLEYISTSSLRTCDGVLLTGQYPSGGQSSGGGSGGGQTLPPCGSSGTCTNCIPPTCTGGAAWNPTYCSCYLYGSPIIIDTDGSGFHLTSAPNGVLFDFYGTGHPVQMSWTEKGSTNGWLALDRNGNGVIDGAKELFGNITPQPSSSDPNGFRALAVFDEPENGGNGDGVIDAQDAVWPKLLVWIDANHDGISEPGELHHLDEMGIHSIDLRYGESRYTDAFGNQFRYKGRLNPDKGGSVNRKIYDVILVQLQPQTAERWTLGNALKSKAYDALGFSRPVRSTPAMAMGCNRVDRR